MDIQIMLWVASGALLLLYLARRRKRKLMR
jgi:hypothetical protein